MAEGLLEQVLGEEQERGESEGPERADKGAVAFAAAIAAGEAAKDKDVARATQAFLREQTRLLKAQREELLEQRALRLRQLESAFREGELRRFGLRLRNGMQLFLALVATAIALGVLTMVYEAAASRQVVVDEFKAPPALAGRGLSGEVVASDVLDTLQKLQDATRSARKLLPSRSAWASDVKIEVPETGVSIGELNRLLHERLGHDVHIGGELVQADGGGLVLTVRGDGAPAATFTGGSGDLEKLAEKAAEYIYGRSQPQAYATYLQSVGRYADSVAFAESAFPRAEDDAARAALANTWASAFAGMNDLTHAVEKWRLAMTLTKPGTRAYWRIWGNLIGGISTTEGEEAAWRESQAMLKAVAAAPASRRPEAILLGEPAILTWDMPLTIAASLQDAAYNGGAGSQLNPAGPNLADDYAVVHDPAQATRWIAASAPNDPTTRAETLLLNGYAALDRGDAAAAVAPLEAFYKAWSADPNLQYSYYDQPCFTALAFGLVGRTAAAEAIFKRIGRWSLCDAFHGDVLAHAKDVAGAQRVWSEAMSTAPDLPVVPLHRGLYELASGDLPAAERDVAYAAGKAPHWADPLKAWGDVLARQGRWAAALAKYDEALKYAPAWVELRAARATAATRAH